MLLLELQVLLIFFIYKVFAVECCPIVRVNQRLKTDPRDLDNCVFGKKQLQALYGVPQAQLGVKVAIFIYKTEHKKKMAHILNDTK